MNSKTNKIRQEYYYDKAKNSKNWNFGKLFIIKKLINKFSTDTTKILEVGCGDATIIKHLLKYEKYFGIDSSEYCINRLKVKYDNKKNIFLKGFAEKLPFGDAEINIIFSDHALEHFDDPKKALKEIIRVLTVGGYVFLLAPNHELPWTKLNAIRHYNGFQKKYFSLLRFIDVFKRIIGIQVFRNLKQNYSQHTGKYELKDDDLTYVTSAYEVVKFLEKNNFKHVPHNEKIEPAGDLKMNCAKRVLKKLIKKIKALKYSDDNLFIIMQKYK